MMRRRGFTLLEVMVGLALLGFGLIVLIKSAAGSMFSAQQSNMLGVVTDLSRAKMYEIEEILIKDGFSDSDQSKENETFDAEGWPEIHYSYKVIAVELPSMDALLALQKQQVGKTLAGSAAALGSGSGSGSGFGSALGSAAGSDLVQSFTDSPLGSMLGMVGGGMGGMFGGSTRDSASQAGSQFMGAFYSMFQQILKVSVRKVTLTVTYKVMGHDRDLTTVAFFTDQAGMDKAIPLLLQAAMSGAFNGSGSAGSGSSAGFGSATSPGKVTK